MAYFTRLGSQSEDRIRLKMATGSGSDMITTNIYRAVHISRQNWINL